MGGTHSANITYDSLISDYNNSDKPGGGDGVMDIDSGHFTCLTAGHYTVTFSGWARVKPGEIAYVSLYHNGDRVDESEWWSYNSGSNRGWIQDQGSRTVIMHLAVGDTLYLRTDRYDGHIFDLVYCVSLTGYDY